MDKEAQHTTEYWGHQEEKKVILQVFWSIFKVVILKKKCFVCKLDLPLCCTYKITKA